MAKVVVIQKLVSVLGFEVHNLPAATSAINRVTRQAEVATARVGAFSSRLGGWGRGLVGIFAGLRLARYIWDVNVQFERLHQQLTTLLGSSRAAEETFAMLRRFAVNTPFEVGELTEAFATLSAVGLRPTEEQLTALGNVASGMSRPITDLATAISRGSVGLFRRLNMFGIQSRKVGDQVTLTFRGVSETMRADLDHITEYLYRLGNTVFASGMARQMNTLGGQFSNLKDIITNAFYDLGRAGASRGLMRIINMMQRFVGRIWPKIEEFGRRLEPLLKKIGDLFGWLAEHVDLVVGALQILVGAWMIGGLTRLAAGVWSFVTATRGAVSATLLWQAAIVALPALFLLLLNDLDHWARGNRSIIGGVLEDWKGEDGLQGTIASVAASLHGFFYGSGEDAANWGARWRTSLGDVWQFLTDTESRIRSMNDAMLGWNEILAAIGLSEGINELEDEYNLRRQSFETLRAQLNTVNQALEGGNYTAAQQVQMEQLRNTLLSSVDVAEQRMNRAGLRADRYAQNVAQYDQQSNWGAAPRTGLGPSGEAYTTPPGTWTNPISGEGSFTRQEQDRFTPESAQRVFTVYFNNNPSIKVSPENAERILRAALPPTAPSTGLSPAAEAWLQTLPEQVTQ